MKKQAYARLCDVKGDLPSSSNLFFVDRRNSNATIKRKMKEAAEKYPRPSIGYNVYFNGLNGKPTNFLF